MDEMTRRRMVWTALVMSIGFLVATLALAALDAMSRGWYAIGAVVYGAAFIVAIVAWLARPDAKPPAKAVPKPEAQRSEYRERIIYSSAHGDVREQRERVGNRATHGFVVQRERGAASKDVERALAAAAAKPARHPGDPELDRALRRWGRVREVS